MNPTALIAAIGASTLLAGVWCFIAGWTGCPHQEYGPSRRSRTWAAISRPAMVRQTIGALIAALMVLALTRWPVAALAAGVAVIGIPRLVTGRAAAQRIQRLEALEQWTRRLADLLSAGRGLEQAIEQSAARNVPAVIAPQVTALARRIIALRVPTEQALRLFANEMGDPIADRIAAALILVARRRGAGASAVLSGLAELVVRDVTDRREVEAARAEHRTTVRWIIAILLTLTTAALLQRSYVAPFGTSIGQVVLAIAMACYGGAFWWLHRLGTPELGYRLLIDPHADDRAER